MTKRIILVALTIITLTCCGSDTTPITEQFIPRIHFSAGEGWTGQPVGLILSEGLYHLFYEANPSEATYGDVSWGHATSRNLVDWEELPLSMAAGPDGYPDAGCVVEDTANTSGLKGEGKAPFLAFYTLQSSEPNHGVFMAWSVDKGLSWAKSTEPVLVTEARWPRVGWSDELDAWIMTLSTGSAIEFHTSPNGLEWTHRGDFEFPEPIPNTWEAAEVFTLPVDGSYARKWVLLVDMVGNGPAEGAPATRCFVGDFDGGQFTPIQIKDLWLDYGKDNCPGVSLRGSEPVRIGWMNCWEYANLLPTADRRGSLTMPRRLSLIEKAGIYYLLSTSVPMPEEWPVREKTLINEPVKMAADTPMTFDMPDGTGPMEIVMRFDNRDRTAIWKASDYGVVLVTDSGKRLRLGYQNEMGFHYIDRSGIEPDVPFSDTFARLMGAANKPQGETTEWKIIVDECSVELFADGGEVAMTALCFPAGKFTSLEMYANGGSVTVTEAAITRYEN